jgi:two-component system, NarL family, nitrate/nitrite response regulator NarL
VREASIDIKIRTNRTFLTHRGSQLGTFIHLFLQTDWHTCGMQFSLKVLVVDDEPLVRGLLTEVLSSMGYEVAAASDAASAQLQAKRFDPDIAILDVDLGSGPNGFDLEASLRHSNPQLETVFLTNVPSPKVLGVSPSSLSKKVGYLHKSNMGDSAKLSEVIRQVSRGFGASYRDDQITKQQLGGLSRSQFEVIEMVARGLSNEEIAELRETSVRAVRRIIARAYQTMGIPNARGAGRVKAALNFLRISGSIK